MCQTLSTGSSDVIMPIPYAISISDVWYAIFDLWYAIWTNYHIRYAIKLQWLAKWRWTFAVCTSVRPHSVGQSVYLLVLLLNQALQCHDTRNISYVLHPKTAANWIMRFRSFYFDTLFFCRRKAFMLSVHLDHLAFSSYHFHKGKI